MNTCLIGTAECLGNPIEYHLVSELSEEGATVYGIQIQLGDEQALIHDLSASEDEVRKLLEAMACGSVSPVSARDIVDDWLLR